MSVHDTPEKVWADELEKVWLTPNGGLPTGNGWHESELVEYLRIASIPDYDKQQARIAELEATLHQERSAKWEILESPLKNRIAELELTLKSVLETVDDGTISVRPSERMKFMGLLEQWNKT